MIIKRATKQLKQSGEINLYDLHELVDSFVFLSFNDSNCVDDNSFETNEELLEQLIEQQVFANELNESGGFDNLVSEHSANKNEFTMSIDGLRTHFRLVNGQILARCDTMRYEKQLFLITEALNATLYDSSGTEIRRKKKGILSIFGL
ncbi:hypothetical protein [Vibrio lentus]|uniref:hypothetical protein n=1 Tax=Vibrio lentus TaxID=136468 RepID=UPI0009755DB3|nr:hypothetical protein [Vibrio lentus]OMO20761.1 hypothetical protein BH583_15580 [Vibrio lentus]PMH95867.1 hypothetical protein BCU54_11260 [Vibrio lentus]PMN11519.1 hypothetical protein BCT38_07000 [Vibrio lentus]